MGILRADRVGGLGGANAINGSVFFGGGNQASGITGNNILITEESSDFTFGTGDFTIEGWFYTPDLSNWNLLVGDNVYSSAGGWGLYFSTNPFVNWWKGAASVVAGASPTVNTWHHVAFSRESGTNRVFLDGALGASASDSTNYTSNQILIGANQLVASTNVSQWGFKGYASNVRVIKGEAIYTAAFTAPTTRLEKTDNTVLLCCQSPGNVLQEATGKTLYTLNTPVASHFVPDVGEDHGTTFADNTKFDTLSYMVPPGGTTAQSNRGRALFGGGSTVINTIQYFNIQSQGNAQDFGDLSAGRYETECASSSTRGLWGGGYIESPNVKVDTIEYVTIATTSNTTDFGNLTVARGHLAGVCNSTRGVFANGTTNPSPHPVVNTIDYITIATAGNATDFGDTTTASKPMGGGRSSTTRGVFTLGNAPSAVNTMEYVTIASTGNSADFGDAIVSGWGRGAGNVSSGTRGILGGGNPALNTIEYITIASLGNGTDFGDLVVGRRSAYSAGSTIRGVFGGGKTPTQLNSIEYITIATVGNAIDFGDLINSKSFASGLSDCHGGLS